MKHSARVVSLLLPLTLLCSNAIGAGFGLYEFSARANAMGGAVVASGAEPASIATNPALITDLTGSRLQIGSTLILPSAKTTFDGVSADSQFSFFVIPNVYFTHQINDRWSAGVGVFSRFGLGNSYPRSWVGSQNAYDIEVQTMSIQPTIAFKATERLSLGAGFEAMYIKFKEGKMIYPNPAAPALNSDMNLEGDGVGFSGILSFAYKANEKVNFGGSYRFKTKQGLDGTANFNNSTAALNGVFANGDVNGTIMLPNQLALGVSYQATEKLMIAASWMNIFWSSFKDISINFDKTPGTGTNGNVTDLKNWHDTYRLGLGVEYALTNDFALRGSYTYDKAPVNADYMDVFIPANDRQLFSVGFGWNITEQITADASYTLLLGNGLTGTSPKGEKISYSDAYANMAGLSLSYKF